MFGLFASSLGSVLLFGLLLGAGLPAVFALGIRFMAAGAGGGAEIDHAAPRPLSRAAGVVCFAIVAGAVVLGITVIVSSGFGYRVSFEHVIPLLEKK